MAELKTVKYPAAPYHMGAVPASCPKVGCAPGLENKLQRAREEGLVQGINVM